MHIGVVVSATTASGGIYQYTRSVILALSSSPECVCTLFVLPECQLDLSSLRRPDWSVEVIPSAMLAEQVSSDALASGILYGCNKPANRYFRGHNVDLLIFPAPWSLAFEAGLPYLMAVHDLQHRLHPEFPEVSADGEWERREYLFLNGIRYATGILVDSEVGKEDLMRCYGDYAVEDTIHVLPFMPSLAVEEPAADDQISDIAELRAKYGIEGPYFFYPAQFWAHKNHARLIQALAVLKSRYGKTRQLVLVGSFQGPSHEQRQQVFDAMWDLAYQLQVAEQVRYLGYVPDHAMKTLYSNALALVMPTFFGPTNIPVLEAWAADCPVVTSDIRGVREQGGNAALLADPCDVNAIASAMNTVENDAVRHQLIANGRMRLQGFDRNSFFNRLMSSIDLCLHRKTPRGGYLVTAIVSAYNSEKFIRGCLDDLVSQTLFKRGQLEIIVIDSASPQQEGAIVSEFLDRYGDSIVYIRTSERETIYQAWNRGARAARGSYLTNANTDDRHRTDALELMAAALDAHPEIALVYADCFVTIFPNETFEKHTRCGYHIRPEYTPEMMLSGCHIGPQPMWRRAVHEDVGWFSEDLRSAGDYEFWCRIASKYDFKHIDQFLGLYYENPEGFANSDAMLSVVETVYVKEKYDQIFPDADEDFSCNFQFGGEVEKNEYVNIGIITRDEPERFSDTLESLIRSTEYPYVITVVDLGSTDDNRVFLDSVKQSGLIRNLIFLPVETPVKVAIELAWQAEPDAGSRLLLGNSIVFRLQGWLTFLVQEHKKQPWIAKLTNRLWSRDGLVSSMTGLIPVYCDSDDIKTCFLHEFCCMENRG